MLSCALDNPKIERLDDLKANYRLWPASCTRHVCDPVILNFARGMIPFHCEGGGAGVIHLQVLRGTTGSCGGKELDLFRQVIGLSQSCLCVTYKIKLLTRCNYLGY